MNANLIGWILTGLAVVGLGYVALQANRTSTANRENTQTLLARFNGSIAELATIKELLAVATAELARLRPALDAANTEINRLRAALDASSQELAALRVAITQKVPGPKLLKPLLLIQCDPAFGETDAQALRRTGIAFQRRSKCTLASFDEVLQTGREDNQTALWLQISAHMNDTRIKFFDQDASIEWLSQRIRRISVLFLAGCENEDVGKQLVGTMLAMNVITVLEPIDTKDAGNFTFAFWRAMSDGYTVNEAFEQALAICPVVSEFVQLRTARERHKLT
jgi:hypothetical protein